MDESETFIYYLYRDNVISGEIMELMTKIAGLYDRSPQAEYSMREAAGRLKGTYSNVYNTIQDMASEGVLTCTVKGRANMCMINLASDKARALLALYAVNRKDDFYKKNKIMAELLGEFVSRIADDNVYAIVLFGSHAKGMAKESSDVDLLVICASKAKADKKVHAEANSLEARYGRAVNPIVVDKGMFVRSLKSEETTAVKGAISDHVLLSGFEQFWKCVAEGLQ